jgi:hypothetical protein|tara:strand:- start:1815 stop:1994 length:180 start_codon:yes stop_codon:yes gene_type:complete
MLKFIAYVMTLSGLFLCIVGASASDQDFALGVSALLALMGLLVLGFGISILIRINDDDE